MAKLAARVFFGANKVIRGDLPCIEYRFAGDDDFELELTWINGSNIVIVRGHIALFHLRSCTSLLLV